MGDRPDVACCVFCVNVVFFVKKDDCGIAYFFEISLLITNNLYIVATILLCEESCKTLI
jgi:hypothetical protein